MIDLSKVDLFLKVILYFTNWNLQKS